MFSYLRISLFLAAFILTAGNIHSQSYEVSDTAPPSTHTLRTYDLSTINILFEEKYRLLVDVDCNTGKLIVDVKLNGGSIVNGIKLIDDSILNISLAPSAYTEGRRISDKIVIPSSFLIRVNLENDTAVFHATCSNDQIQVTTEKESWFIEAEPLLKLPVHSFWIISDELKVINRIKDSLNTEKLSQNIILEGGYYRCFPTGYVWRKGIRNECSKGPVYFFICDIDMDIHQVELIVKSIGCNSVLFGSNM